MWDDHAGLRHGATRREEKTIGGVDASTLCTVRLSTVLSTGALIVARGRGGEKFIKEKKMERATGRQPTLCSENDVSTTGSLGDMDGPF